MMASCYTISPAGGFVYVSDGTKFYVPPATEILDKLPPEERTRLIEQGKRDQEHLAKLYPEFQVRPESG